jgi:hypothetical protein
MRAMAIQVYGTQKFAGRRRKRDRRGFVFVAATSIRKARARSLACGRYRARRTPSFVRAEFWDRDASLAAVKAGQPVPGPLVIE